MTYNKYTAPEYKVLFNTENFTYGDTILSVHDLNLIILDKAEAEALSKIYREEQDKLQEQENNPEQQATFAARTNIATMALNENGEYEETEDDPLLAFRKEKLIELMAKGVNLNPKINKLKLNTTHI